jgi:polysaccharide biosynthesis/export protein
MPEQQPIKVTYENTVLIPRIGEISVAGKTLTQARKLILDKLTERNPNAIVGISLYQPRIVLITVSGNVLAPGTYSFPACYRVSTALKMVNNIKMSSNISISQQDFIIKQTEKKNEELKNIYGSGISEKLPYYTRNIQVVHIDGSSEILDIETADISNKLELDPFIREGDKIFVPYNPTSYPSISINGEVIRPLAIPYKKGDKASILIKLCRGFSNEANLNDIKLFLNNSDNPVILSLDDKLNLSSDYDLQDGATIIVGKIKETRIDNRGMASVTGLVNKPGVYFIEPNKTRLKDLINIAGGFTNDAYLPLSNLIRQEKNSDFGGITQRDLFKKFQYSDLTLDDTARYVLDAYFRKPVVSCDFVAAFEKNSEKDNILIQDGDIIVISAKPKSVYVWGQVNQPGYVNFSDDKTMDWYIKQAGGYASGSEKSRTRIIRGKNFVWTEGDSDTFLYAGDEIYVPRPPYEPQGLDIQRWSVVAGVLGATAALLNVIIWSFR